MLRRRFLSVALFAFGLSGLGGAPFAAAAATPAAPAAAPAAGRAPRIVLLHPTRANLEVFDWLLDHGVITCPAPELIGVYHEREAYDYTASRDYAAAHPERRRTFVVLTAPLAHDQLYQRNACTDTFRALVRDSDAMIFWGGPDLPPATYGRPTSLLTDITDPGRHALELSLLFHLLGGSQDPAWTPLLAARPDYPVLGFCLGMQTMNVATGGTMIQDIPSEIYGCRTAEDVLALPADQVHRNYWKYFGPDERLTGGTLHRIRLLPDGDFVRAWGCAASLTPAVYSSHHQAVDRLGAGFEVLATSLDGKIVEAIRHRTFRQVLGVQFHPEVRSLYGGPGPAQLTPQETATGPLADRLTASGGDRFHRTYWAHFSAQLRR